MRPRAGQRREGSGARLIVDAEAPQIVANARITEALRTSARDRGCEALVRQEVIALEVVEHADQFCWLVIFAEVARQLAGKLGAAMVAPSEKRDCAA